MKEYCFFCGLPLQEWEWCGRGLCGECEDFLDSIRLVPSPFVPVDGETNHLLPVPDSDLYRDVKTQDELDRYVEDYGIKYMRYDDDMKRWECPEMNAGRKKFAEHKKEDCDKYGCE